MDSFISPSTVDQYRSHQLKDVQYYKNQFPGFYNDACYEVLAEASQPTLQNIKICEDQIERIVELLADKLFKNGIRDQGEEKLR